ncbi:MAG: signal peptidase I, partial [Nitrososphaerales archaeon]
MVAGWKLVLIVASLPLLLYLWPSLLGGDTEYVTVYGTSMLPTFPPGSLAITKKMLSYDVGDIVAFNDSELKRTVVHRIIEEVNGGFITKGDNNRANDHGVLRPDDVIGEVVFITPYLGYPVIMLKNPVVMTLTVLALAALMPTKKKKANPKAKSTDSFFLPAIITNLVTYVIVQIHIAMGMTPKADAYTSFLFRIFEPSFASTLSFATWFLAIMGVYLALAHYQSKNSTLEYAQQNTIALKSSASMTFMAQIFWLLF